MILALFVKRKKRNILLCIYRENGKDGAFYLSIILHGKSNGAVLVPPHVEQSEPPQDELLPQLLQEFVISESLIKNTSLYKKFVFICYL